MSMGQDMLEREMLNREAEIYKLRIKLAASQNRIELLEKDREAEGISAKEALFGFCCWLSTQDDPIIIGSKFDSVSVMEAMSTFCKANNLPSSCNSYPGFQYPDDIEIDNQSQEEIDRQLKNIPAMLGAIENLKKKLLNEMRIDKDSIWYTNCHVREYIALALSQLSGDLNYDKVCEAKKTLRQMLDYAKVRKNNA